MLSGYSRFKRLDVPGSFVSVYYNVVGDFPKNSYIYSYLDSLEDANSFHYAQL